MNNNTIEEKRPFGGQVSNLSHIQSYLHCGLCLDESGDDPYTQKLEFGWTKWGIQAWCREHDANIIHVDFEGAQHPGDTTRQKRDDELV